MKNYLPRLKPAFIAALLLTNTVLLFSQGTGIIDSAFGNNGQVLTKIAANGDDISQSVAVTPDNKIVVTGNSSNIFGYSKYCCCSL